MRRDAGMEVRVVLVEPKRWENVGAVARVMKNFGFSSLYIVISPPDDSASQHSIRSIRFQNSTHFTHAHAGCTHIDRRAFYVASHAEDVLERCKIVYTVEDAIANSHIVVGTTAKIGSEMNVLRRPFFEPEQLGKFTMRKRGILSLLFGREDIGLLNEELKRCDIVLHIPAHHEHPVMNLSHAVAIVLYEIYKFRRTAGAATRLASVEDREHLLAHFRTLLERVEHREHRRERTMIVLRHIFGRAGVTSREVRTVHGMLRKTLRMLARKAGER